MYRNFLKRFFDIIISLIVFICFIPVLSLVFVLLLISNRGVPLFYQLRPGLNGRTFRIIKFKTMNDRKDDDGNLLPDAIRLTSIGKFIRKTSLDEIPQLINVIIGDMSLIGPRPLLVEYLPLYNSEQQKRHLVKPGITGWAQVNGRNAISWTEKFSLDVFYINNLSFFLDVKIIWLTILKVIKSQDISADNQATMSKFEGN